ncbi:transposase [Streptosporangium sp. NPDC002544]|uniref:transposase n=1 Tax=unclassified Streptosporangium TaxID=2632669 RepID=UPI00331D37B8
MAGGIGTASPGVARRYSGPLGKVGNCQIGVSVHALTDWPPGQADAPPVINSRPNPPNKALLARHWFTTLWYRVVVLGTTKYQETEEDPRWTT